MNSFAFAPQQARQPNPQLLLATMLVTAVSRDVQSLAPEVLREGTAIVSQNRIAQWQSALQAAVSQIRQIPVPLIFPPPRFITFANEAVNQISQALSTLASIPSAAPLTFPPQFGSAIISLEILQSLLSDLQQAEALLIRALQSA